MLPSHSLKNDTEDQWPATRKTRSKTIYVVVVGVICLMIAIQTLFLVWIFGDKTPPVISVSPQQIEYGQTLALNDFVQATDNRPGEITLAISDISPSSGIDVNGDRVTFSALGEYTIAVSASDRRGNLSSEEVLITVPDSFAPELSVASPSGTIAYGSSVSLSSDSIACMVSDMSGVSCIISKITSTTNDTETNSYIISSDRQSVELLFPGDYEITVQAIDDYGNTASKTIELAVVDNVAPELTVPETMQVEYGTKLEIPVSTKSEDSWLTVSDISDVSISIVDVSPAFAALSYYIYEDRQSVEFRNLGDYTVTVLAEDSYGNTSEEIVRVTTVDTTAPILSDLPNEFTLTESDLAPDFLSGVSAMDNVDGDLTENIVVDALNVSYGVPGNYNVVYSVYDHSGNKTEKIVPLEIRDTTPPVVQLATESFTVTQGASAVDFAANLSAATDGTDGDLTDSVVVDDSAVDYDAPGKYEVSYTVSDHAGNSTRKVVYVTVTAPTVVSSTISSSTGSDGEIVYITATGSKYHRSGCSYLSKSKISISLSSAKAKGYTACSRCF